MKQTKFKKTIGWLHLWLGIPAGLTIFIVALTGSILTFEDELEPVLFKSARIVEVTSTHFLPLDSLMNVAQREYPEDKMARMVMPEAPGHTAEFRLGPKGKSMKVVFMNPYNANVVYKGFYNQRFFQTVKTLHRILLMGDFGKMITGISCVICLFLVISGIYLWWPANKKAIKQRFRIKWDASGKRLTWDLHAVSGFYLSFFLLLITLTGLVWSYDWVDQLIYKLADGKVMKEAKVKNLHKEEEMGTGIYERMVVQMNNIYPGPGTVTLNLPAKPGLAVTVQKERAAETIVVSDAGYFDSKTGNLVKKIPFEELSTGSKIRKMNLPVHSGSIFGWPTKLLALIVALFTASLPVTGILIWWRTGKKKKKTVRTTLKPLRTGLAK